MAEPFIGSEAVASRVLVKSALRTQYTKLFRDVYVSPDTELTPQLRAHASASALHGAKWVDITAPLEIIHANRNPLHGMRVRGDGIGEDEVVVIEGVPATTPSRTALDLGCWYPRSEAVAAINTEVIDGNIPGTFGDWSGSNVLAGSSSGWSPGTSRMTLRAASGLCHAGVTLAAKSATPVPAPPR
jgi:hypothetical protein